MKKKRKVFTTMPLEDTVTYMFNQVLKKEKEKKTKSRFLLELLELYRKQKNI